MGIIKNSPYIYLNSPLHFTPDSLIDKTSNSKYILKEFVFYHNEWICSSSWHQKKFVLNDVLKDSLENHVIALRNLL